MKGFTTIKICIVLVIVAMLVVIVAGLPAQKREQDAWMSDCLQHEALYSCEVKWKQMHPDPIVVYAPLNK